MHAISDPTDPHFDRPLPGETSPETTKQIDPNADLIGRKVVIADRIWTIDKTTSWSERYIILERDWEDDEGEERTELLCRPADIVRRYIQLGGGA